MKPKLKEYIDTIFADAERRAPNSARLAELKEEMLRNLYDKYDDLIAAGRTPAAAYNSAVAGVGDISDLLDSVAPPRPASASAPDEKASPDNQKRPLTPEEQARLSRWRDRSALVTSVAIALYILCCVPLFILGDVGDGVLGLVLMFMMIAAATALLIYNAKTKPTFDETADRDRDDDDDDDDGRASADRPARSPVYKAISGGLWAIGVCVYLLVSFLSGYWHITWMIFLILTAVDNIIKVIFDLRR